MFLFVVLGENLALFLSLSLFIWVRVLGEDMWFGESNLPEKLDLEQSCMDFLERPSSLINSFGGHNCRTQPWDGNPTKRVDL